ncbi:putative mitochondrial protein AtMg00710 [Tasmannia lanceolata]|uniref:putative mitochondrial protein AtMg00710 n=1 Tax=Tasmannia lanceolata TaxID=3420 RepID=UPI0040647AE2
MTLLERARSMLSNAGLEKYFWAEAVNTACYLVNTTPLTAISCKTPEEVWSGKPSDYSILRIFGCPAYIHVKNDQRSKLDPKSKKFIFLGYASGVKGFRIVEEGKHDTGETIEVEVDTLREVQKENIQVEFSEARLHE